MKLQDSINKRLRENKKRKEKKKARAYVNNVDEAMLEYYRVYAKQIKFLPPEPQLSDFYHQSERKKKKKEKSQTIIYYCGYRLHSTFF